MTRIAVLVSGGGTNLQALIDTQESEGLGDGELSLVVSSVPEVFALDRAEKAGIKSLVLDTKNYAKQSEFDAALSSTLSEHDIGLVVLAGFLCVIGQKTLCAFENRIINVHPSLIPSFCGKGFYGLHVHKAALEKGVKVTGATVHFVNNEIDGGKIILQKAVDVLADDTPQTLQQRVMKEAEWVILPKAVRMFCNGEIK